MRDDGGNEAIRAAAGEEGKSRYVRQIFSEIAPRYDLLNHLLSFNMDRAWRRKAIASMNISRRPHGSYLDLCAGTLDISASIARTAGFGGRVISVDFAEPMLRAGLSKIVPGRIAPVAGDALALPISTASMSGAIVAFGIRNVSGLDAALREVHRVLEPGARLVILEFSIPRSALMNSIYQVYFRGVLPFIGKRVSGHATAYEYLPRSVANFPVTEELARRMRATGFSSVGWRSLTLGAVAIHWGER